MASKLTLIDISSGFKGTDIQTNFTSIEDEFDDTLSRSGKSPNQMEATLDMNDNQIVHLKKGSSNTSAARLQDIEDLANVSDVQVSLAEGDVPSNKIINDRGFAQKVDSVADLQAGSYSSSLDRLWLSGYYGVGTAGGGPLYRDASDTTTADNGITVFVDSDGVRWKRPLPTTVVDVTMGGMSPSQTASVNATQFQNAIDSLDPGWTIRVPAGIYEYDTGVQTDRVNIVGDGYRSDFRGPKDDSQYQDDSRYEGTVLRFTAGSGVAITSGQDIAEEYHPQLKDFIVIGATSNTATGIKANRILSGHWENVKAANFDRCWNINWAEDTTFLSIRASGGNTGLYSKTSGTNQNVFINAEINQCDVGIDMAECVQNTFYGGLVQGGNLTDGIVLGSRARDNVFHSMWMEATWSGDAIRTEGDVCGKNRFHGFHFNADTSSITLNGGTGSTGDHVLEDFVLTGGASMSTAVNVNNCCLARISGSISVTDNGNGNSLTREAGLTGDWQHRFDYDRGQVRNLADRAPLQFDGIDETTNQYIGRFRDNDGNFLSAWSLNNGQLFRIEDANGDEAFSFRLDIKQFTSGGAVVVGGRLSIPDGISTPIARAGETHIFVDSSDGDLKVQFSDGTVKSITTDT